MAESNTSATTSLSPNELFDLAAQEVGKYTSDPQTLWGGVVVSQALVIRTPGLKAYLPVVEASLTFDCSVGSDYAEYAAAAAIGLVERDGIEDALEDEYGGYRTLEPSALSSFVSVVSLEYDSEACRNAVLAREMGSARLNETQECELAGYARLNRVPGLERIVSMYRQINSKQRRRSEQDRTVSQSQADFVAIMGFMQFMGAGVTGVTHQVPLEVSGEDVEIEHTRFLAPNILSPQENVPVGLSSSLKIESGRFCRHRQEEYTDGRRYMTINDHEGLLTILDVLDKAQTIDGYREEFLNRGRVLRASQLFLSRMTQIECPPAGVA